jgi:hypothetical protein
MYRMKWMRLISLECLVWVEANDAERKARDGKIAEQAKLVEEMKARREEIRKSGTKLMPGGSL